MDLFLVLGEDNQLYSVFDDEGRAYREVCAEILAAQCYPEDEQNDLIRLYNLRCFKEAYQAACMMRVTCGFMVAAKELNKSNFVEEK